MRAAAAVKPTANKQSLAPVQKDAFVDKPIKYMVGGKSVELSVALTQKYFCPEATPAEAFVFNAWCQHNGLDPWKKEAYLVKYGNNPPQMLTAKDAFTKRAEANPRYQGSQAGVVVRKEDGTLENRLGELVLEDEEIVGGWADVYVKDYVKPISSVVGFRERCQYKSDGKPMAKWATSPALMIRKCALVAAMREAFPNEVGGMYIPDEMEAGATINDEDAAPTAYQDVSYTDVATGEVFTPTDDDDEPSIFDTEG